MNTDTGNIFAILNGDALAANEVELTAKQFAELIPMRSLEDRLGAYAQMKKPQVEEEPEPLSREELKAKMEELIKQMEPR